MSRRVPRQPKRRIFAVPMLLGLTSLVGLIIGLTGDGLLDWLSWLLLALPLLAVTAAWRGRESPVHNQN